MMTMQRALTLLAVAFFLFVAFQAYELILEHANLEATRAGQQRPLEQALQISKETQALAGDVAILANKGMPTPSKSSKSCVNKALH
jgi:hypothetical protein